MLKRIISCVILSAFLVFSVSCAAPEAETVPEYVAGSAELSDFGGYELTFLSDFPVEDPFEMGIDTLFSEMMQERVKDVASSYNCSFIFQNTSAAQTDILGYVMSGSNMPDLYYGSSSSGLAYAGLLYPLENVSEIIDINDTNKYGTPNLLEFSMFEGKHYGVVPVMWPTKIAAANFGGLVVIGENLVSKYNLDDPRDYYEQGVWTLEKLDEITPAFCIDEGDRKVLALCGSVANVSCGFFGAVGMKMVHENSDGTLTAGYNTPEMVEVLTWAADYCARHKGEIDISGGADTYLRIINEETILAVQASHISRISSALDNFGIIPFPHFQKVIDAGEQNAYYDFFNTLSILDLTGEPEISATVVSALCDPFEGYYSNWDELTDFLNQTVFFDERDGRNFINMVKHCVSDYNQAGGYAAFAEGGLGGAFLTMPASQAVEKFADRQDKIIEEYIKGNYEVMKEYWEK